MKSTLALALLVAASLGSACSSSGEVPVSTSQPAESAPPPASASSSSSGNGPSSSGGASSSSSGGSSSGAMDSGVTIDAGDAGGKNDAGAATDAGASDAGSPTVAFTKGELQALVNAHCDGCHIGGASAGMSLAGDFTVQTVGVASTEVPTLQRIHPGKRSESYLFHKIAGTHASVGGVGVRMPKGGPYLSALEIERIGLFIDGL